MSKGYVKKNLQGNLYKIEQKDVVSDFLLGL